MDSLTLQPIAHMHSDFPAKFGIPRQSGVVPALRARVVFAPAFRMAECVRGLEDFSHIWLLWGFSAARRDGWSPTVRPPRLGGNKRIGVFATRSPFRPNGIGLSCVQLVSIEQDAQRGPVLHVAGADLMDGTPIYDIKPYLPYADCRPDATGGFTDPNPRPLLRVQIAPALLARVAPSRREALLGVLAQDPRPSYQDAPDRLYGMAFGDLNIRFTVAQGVLTVREIDELAPQA